MQRRFRAITLAFIISFVTIAALSFYSIRQFSSLISYSNDVDRTNEVITHLHSVRDVLRDFDMREREYMILRDSSFLQNYNPHIADLNKTFTELKDLIADNEGQANKLILLRSALFLRIELFRKNLAYLDTARGNKVSAYYMDGILKKDECYLYLDNMLKSENTLLDTRYFHKQHFQYLTSQATVWLLVIFFILTIALFFLMIYELKQKMKYEEALQTQLIDLENSHAELEQIAFAASHDMQEPLRKIKILGDRLLWIRKGSADEELKTSIERISVAANEVQELTQEIIRLASLVKSKNFEDDVNIKAIINEVLDEKKEEISAKQAKISISALPEITGDAAQLKILFEHLLDNALKFSKDAGDTKITINGTITSGDDIEDINTANKEKKFYRIAIADNGIGFDNVFVGKIFKVFQRLHNDESPYDGKGIGLAICQRIMINHRGFITASGTVDEGATFVLYFPMES